MGLLWWPKTTSTTHHGGALAGSTAPASTAGHGSSSKSCICSSGRLYSKLLRKLKRKSRSIMPHPPTRQPSFQYRYDPLSYSLNFDATGCGALSGDDQAYYDQFCAFSSRFVAPPKAAASHPMEVSLH